MKKNLILAGALGGSVLMTAAAGHAGNGNPFNPRSGNVLTVAVYGDAPYGLTPTDDSETLATPAFIESINADPKVDLVLHVGDIHSGKQFCTEAYDRTIFDLWKAYKDPVIYTPGDNEWTDCNKAGEGGGAYNKTTHQIDYVLDASGQPADYAKGYPLANLDLIRDIFFSVPGQSLGGRKKAVSSQSAAFDPAHPTDAEYVENVMWEESNTMFVTINLPGGSNNDADKWFGQPITKAQTDEMARRTAADLRWLEAAFARAAADGVGAVLIQTQADMWDAEKGAAHQANYEPIVANVAALTQAFGKPVLMFNGDSHVYKSDNPLSLSDTANLMHPGYGVENFHRIVVHGSTFPLEWLRLTVDPHTSAPAGAVDAFGPFSWEREIQAQLTPTP